jgi:hypothetical protein
MTRMHSAAALADRAIVRRNRADRAFDLHPAMFAATVGAYFLFLAIMGLTFMNGELWLPFAVFVAYIAMAFGVPALWARMVEPREGRFASWSEFMAEGLDTGSGWLNGKAVVAQVMTLPVLIVGWGLIIAAIRAGV